MRLLLTGLFVLCVSPSLRGDVIVGTTFDADRQNWYTTFGSATGTATLWQSVGGNSGGYLRALDRTDASNFVWYFENNVTFNGNRTNAYLGSLQYDIIRFASGSPLTLSNSNADVFLSGAGMLFMHKGSVPTGSWVTMNIPLSPGSWTKVSGGVDSGINPTEAEFLTLLGSLSNLRIRGNYNLELNDITGLDNVFLMTAVPEASAAMLLSSAMGFIGLRRTRKN